MTLPLAAALGWAAGMRSMAAPALLARALGGRRGLSQPARFLSASAVRSGLALAAAGEVAADKLPAMPPRTDPPALYGRIASGALVGAAVAASRGSARVPAAVVGAAAAMASSFVMADLRAEAGARLGVPDPAIAVVEDAAALVLGARAAQAAARR